jgi:hypothetical protein
MLKGVPPLKKVLCLLAGIVMLAVAAGSGSGRARTR